MINEFNLPNKWKMANKHDYLSTYDPLDVYVTHFKNNEVQATYTLKDIDKISFSSNESLNYIYIGFRPKNSEEDIFTLSMGSCKRRHDELVNLGIDFRDKLYSWITCSYQIDISQRKAISIVIEEYIDREKETKTVFFMFDSWKPYDFPISNLSLTISHIPGNENITAKDFVPVENEFTLKKNFETKSYVSKIEHLEIELDKLFSRFKREVQDLLSQTKKEL